MVCRAHCDAARVGARMVALEGASRLNGDSRHASVRDRLVAIKTMQNGKLQTWQKSLRKTEPSGKSKQKSFRQYETRVEFQVLISVRC